MCQLGVGVGGERAFVESQDGRKPPQQEGLPKFPAILIHVIPLLTLQKTRQLSGTIPVCYTTKIPFHASF